MIWKRRQINAGIVLRHDRQTLSHKEVQEPRERKLPSGRTGKGRLLRKSDTKDGRTVTFDHDEEGTKTQRGHGVVLPRLKPQDAQEEGARKALNWKGLGASGEGICPKVSTDLWREEEDGSEGAKAGGQEVIKSLQQWPCP